MNPDFIGKLIAFVYVVSFFIIFAMITKAEFGPLWENRYTSSYLDLIMAFVKFLMLFVILYGVYTSILPAVINEFLQGYLNAQTLDYYLQQLYH